MGGYLTGAGALLVAAGLTLTGCTETPTLYKPSGTGSGTVLTWTDGNAPVSQSSGVALELNNVTFANGLFVAVGEAGTIITSPDGVHWTSQNSMTSANLYAVTFAKGQFIAVGEDVVSGSPDGTTWTSNPLAGSLTLPAIGITYANGQFVAVGNDQIFTSTDGTTWNAPVAAAPSGLGGPTVDLYDVAFGNDVYVAVGTYNTSTPDQEIAYDGLIATSPDGMSWSTLPYTSNYLSGVTYGGGQFVAVGREGSILTSPDGTHWTAQSAPQLNAGQTPYLINVIYTGTQYVATGNYVGINPSTGFLLTSSDAKSWTVQPIGPNLYGVAYGTVAGVGTYVAVGGQ